jgi:nucleotide-binding universal stress UspA family protein
MYDRRLVPTDGSAGTETVVTQALGTTTRFAARVDALGVVDGTFPAATAYDHVVEALEAEANDALDAVVRACEEASAVDPHLRRGVPHEEIVAAARGYGSDRVVIGSHGWSGLDRIRNLGSVTERVVRTAPVPVLSVPLGRREEGKHDGDER